MPIYEYRCQSCGHELEKLRRMNDPALTDCPACNLSDLKRLISAAGFRLKGAGWYETDFKKGSKKNLHDSGESGSEASEPTASEPAASESAASDSKAKTKPAQEKATSKPKSADKKADAA